MIDTFKKDIIEEIKPMENSWIESSYFKEVYSYVNAPNVDIKTRRENLISYINSFFIEIYNTISNNKKISQENMKNMYLKAKTLSSAYDHITKRYNLMLRVSKNVLT